MMNHEVDEITDDDLEALEAYYQSILDQTLPQTQAIRIASERYGIVLDSLSLNKIMGQYACTPLPLEECVRRALEVSP